MDKYSNCCSALMRGNSLDTKICPDCKEHCDFAEDEMEEETPEKLLTTEQAEEVLAYVIDTLYLKMKADFADYKAQTHKLGFFKESVKAGYNQVMELYKLTGKLFR